MANKKKYFNLSPSDVLLHKLKDEITNHQKGQVSSKGFRESLANNLAVRYNRRRGI